MPAQALLRCLSTLQLPALPAASGTALYVDVDAKEGAILKAGVLVSGVPVPGMSLQEISAITGNYVAMAVSWTNITAGATISALPEGKPIALRFVMFGKVDLYSFWVDTPPTTIIRFVPSNFVLTGRGGVLGLQGCASNSSWLTMDSCCRRTRNWGSGIATRHFLHTCFLQVVWRY